MENVNNIKNIAVALVKAQSEMSNATKNSQNPFLKNKYADLNSVREAVIPHLNKNGIVVLQPTVVVDGKNYIRTTLLHESGEMLSSDTEIVASQQNSAQAQGSGITYARRYGLQSFICIGADDDDGNKASKQKPLATMANLQKAKAQGKTLQDVEKYYNLTQEMYNAWGSM